MPTNNYKIILVIKEITCSNVLFHCSSCAGMPREVTEIKDFLLKARSKEAKGLLITSHIGSCILESHSTFSPQFLHSTLSHLSLHSPGALFNEVPSGIHRYGHEWEG